MSWFVVDETTSPRAKRLLVAGDSAGGTLALAVALKARDTQGPELAGQVLIYPAVNNNYDTDSYKSFAPGYGLTRADMQWFWKQYLADTEASVYAVPAEAQSLQGLPPTTIVLAGYDVLRDEGRQLAIDLEKAGVAIGGSVFIPTVASMCYCGMPGLSMVNLSQEPAVC